MSADTSNTPEARNEGLIVQQMADEVLVYDRDRQKAHCLNRTAALAWRHCDGRNNVSAIAQRVSDELGAPVEEDVVWLALDQLSKRRLLKMPLQRKPGVSRRALMKGVGIAALTLPLITSIVSSAEAQPSCFPNGTACVTNGQCCSNNCAALVCSPPIVFKR